MIPVICSLLALLRNIYCIGLDQWLIIIITIIFNTCPCAPATQLWPAAPSHLPEWMFYIYWWCAACGHENEVGWIICMVWIEGGGKGGGGLTELFLNFRSHQLVLREQLSLSWSSAHQHTHYIVDSNAEYRKILIITGNICTVLIYEERICIFKWGNGATTSLWFNN